MFYGRILSILLCSGQVPQRSKKGEVIFLTKDRLMDPFKFRPIAILSRIKSVYKKILLARLQEPVNTSEF